MNRRRLIGGLLAMLLTAAGCQAQVSPSTTNPITAAPVATARPTTPQSRESSPAETIAPAAVPALVRFPGEGQQASPPFELPAGDYRVEWSATASNNGCVLGISLEPIGSDEPVGPVAFEIAPDNETITGSTVLDLDGGRYVLDVSGSGCTWSVSLAKL